VTTRAILRSVTWRGTGTGSVRLGSGGIHLTSVCIFRAKNQWEARNKGADKIV